MHAWHVLGESQMEKEPLKIEEKQLLKIPKGFLGQFAKDVPDLELEYTDTTLQLLHADSKISASLPAPWNWTDITGVDLRYTPLGLQRIVFEVKLTRKRESTNVLTEDSFVVLYFRSLDIPLMETLLEKHNLTGKVKEGISDYLLTPPVSYLYSIKVRRAMNVVGKISKLFVTLCFATSLFKWLFYCHPDQAHSGEKCVTYLGYFLSLFTSVLSLAYDVAITPLLAFLEYLISPFPKIKYLFLGLFSIVLLPIWPVIGVWGLALYFSDFVIRFHVLFYFWNAISMATANYQLFAYIWRTFNQLSLKIWNTFRTKKKITSKLTEFEKKVQ